MLISFALGPIFSVEYGLKRFVSEEVELETVSFICRGLQLAAASCSRLLAKCCKAHLPAGGVLLSCVCLCKLGVNTLRGGSGVKGDDTN